MRPASITKEEWDHRWDLAFGLKTLDKLDNDSTLQVKDIRSLDGNR